MGQRFEIDVEAISLNDAVLASDDVHEVSDYTKLFQIIEHDFRKKKYNLIESLASEISKSLLKEPHICEVTVRVRKPHAPIDSHFSDIEVEVNSKS